MAPTDLRTLYSKYIDCLNARDWQALGSFVSAAVIHNGRPLGLEGYRAMLDHNFADIPHLRFNVGLLVIEPPLVAARLEFDCTPSALFMGLPVDGERVAFCENVFCAFRDGLISQVWLIIDVPAIAAQVGRSRRHSG